MISFSIKGYNTLSPYSYNKFIQSVDLRSLHCECDPSASFSIHAYYNRYVKTPVGKILYRICRVICSYCGVTHALIPICIIPYTQRSLQDTVCLFLAFHKNIPFSSIFDHFFHFDPAEIYRLRKHFLLNWHSFFLDHIPLFEKNSYLDIFSTYFAVYTRNLSQNRRNKSDFSIFL